MRRQSDGPSVAEVRLSLRKRSSEETVSLELAATLVQTTTKTMTANNIHPQISLLELLFERVR